MELAIYGAGGVGREILMLARQINECKKRWQDFLFVDDSPNEKAYGGVPVCSFEQALLAHPHNNLEFVIAIGEPDVKRRLFEKVRRQGHPFATLIHPQVFVPQSAKIGSGTVLYPGVFLSCDTQLGSNVLVLQNASISHDACVGEHSVLCGHANLAGGCAIGKSTFIAMNAAVKEKVVIGNHCIIGMGAVVNRDIADGTVAFGNPARPVKKSKGVRVFHHPKDNL